MDELPEVLRTVEGVDVKAVADFAGDPADVLVDAGDIDRDLRVLDGPGIEEGGHQVEAVELPPEVELGPVLPAVPDRAERQDHLADPRPRRLPLHGEAPLVVALDLGAEPQDEAAV